MLQANASNTTNPIWKTLWSIALPKKQLLLIWKLLCHALPSSDILRHHHLNVDMNCQFGCHEDETLLHIFAGCLFSKAIWSHGVSIRPPTFSSLTSFTDWLKQVFITLHELGENDILQKVIILLNSIWRQRNLALHEKKKTESTSHTKGNCGRVPFLQNFFQQQLFLQLDSSRTHSTMEAGLTSIPARMVTTYSDYAGTSKENY